MPSDDRPREKLLNTPLRHISSSELLALLIGSGHKDKGALGLSFDILSKYNLRSLSCVSVGDLCSIKGIGISKSSRIIAAFELGRRMLLESVTKKNKIIELEDAVLLFQNYIGNGLQEVLACLFLDSRGQTWDISQIE